MPDDLDIINRVIEEHHRIHGNIKLVGEAINDLEAMSSLQQVYSGWTLSSAEAVAEKQKQLQQTMNLLEDGLNRHFAFEELSLPPLLGKLLMQALLLEHQEIRKKIDQARVALDTPLEGLEREKLLPQKSRIQQLINALCQITEEHANREEVILNMVKRGLE